LRQGGVVSSKPSEMYQMLNKGEANPLIARNVEEYEKLIDFVFFEKPFIPNSMKVFLVKEAIKNQDNNKKNFQLLKTPKQSKLNKLTIIIIFPVSLYNSTVPDNHRKLSSWFL